MTKEEEKGNIVYGVSQRVRSKEKRRGEEMGYCAIRKWLTTYTSAVNHTSA